MVGWKIYYYTTSDGTCELSKYLESLSSGNRQKVMAWITMLGEKGPTLPRPFADFLEDGIHELRVKLSGEQTRILYFFVFQECIILTHSFTKITSAVPKSEIARAKKSRDDLKRRYKTINDFRKSQKGSGRI
jgi:phage-related protein